MNKPKTGGKTLTMAQLINRRRNRALDEQDTRSLLLRIAFLALAAWILLTQVFLFTQVKGSDMFPAMKDGDLVIAFRMQKEFAKEDVVVYTLNGERRIGRIIGRGKDVVNMDESGSYQVNGTSQSGEIMYPTYAREGQTYPYKVPEGCVFIMGDYRTQAEDSRDFGAVPMKDVEAKVITILRRRGL